MNKAKEILLNKVRSLRYKAMQKRKEADRLLEQALNILEEVSKLK